MDYANWTFSWFDFVPAWVIQDIIIILLGVITLAYIVKNEKRPIPIILEMFAFIFLYASLYENFATVIGLYGYGRSIAMIFNVPLTVPLIEFLFVYVSIRMARKMKLKTWMIPLFAGVFGVLADLTLDPLALSQVADTSAGTIGRWTWYIGKTDVNVFGVPIYNFTGWMILCGYAAAFILLGRYWYKKSGYKGWVGIAYPFLCFLAAFVVMMSPVSGFLVYLSPFFNKGGFTELIMLGLCFIILVVILVYWRGRMKEKLVLAKDYPVLLIFGIFHLSNIIFTIIGGRFDILLFSLPFMAVQMGIIWWAFTSKNIVKQV